MSTNLKNGKTRSTTIVEDTTVAETGETKPARRARPTKARRTTHRHKGVTVRGRIRSFGAALRNRFNVFRVKLSYGVHYAKAWLERTGEKVYRITNRKAASFADRLGESLTEGLKSTGKAVWYAWEAGDHLILFVAGMVLVYAAAVPVLSMLLSPFTALLGLGTAAAYQFGTWKTRATIAGAAVRNTGLTRAIIPAVVR